jgi:hypothetical protein
MFVLFAKGIGFASCGLGIQLLSEKKSIAIIEPDKSSRK